MNDTTATATTATRKPFYGVNDYCLRVISMAEKEVRFKTRDKRFLSSFDRELLRDKIVEKAWSYYNSFDPTLGTLEGLVSRIARNTILDYVDQWMRKASRTVSLDRLLGWGQEDGADSDRHSSPRSLYLDAAERFRDTGCESEIESMDRVAELRSLVSRVLSEKDQRIISMLEQGMEREEMAESFGCTKKAMDKRVHDTHVRAKRALGGLVARSRKASRETTDLSEGLPALFLCALMPWKGYPFLVKIWSTIPYSMASLAVIQKSRSMSENTFSSSCPHLSAMMEQSSVLHFSISFAAMRMSEA